MTFMDNACFIPGLPRAIGSTQLSEKAWNILQHTLEGSGKSIKQTKACAKIVIPLSG